MVKPLGESRDIRDVFPDLAKKIGGGMEKWYEYGTTEDYMREWAKGIPKNDDGKQGLDRLLQDGAWEDPSRKPFYEPFAIELDASELEGTKTNENGIISRDGIGVGIRIGDKSYRGFKTPSRKFEIRSLFVNKVARNEDCSELIQLSGRDENQESPCQTQRTRLRSRFYADLVTTARASKTCG